MASTKLYEVLDARRKRAEALLHAQVKACVDEIMGVIMTTADDPRCWYGFVRKTRKLVVKYVPPATVSRVNIGLWIISSRQPTAWHFWDVRAAIELTQDICDALQAVVLKHGLFVELLESNIHVTGWTGETAAEYVAKGKMFTFGDLYSFLDGLVPDVMLDVHKAMLIKYKVQAYQKAREAAFRHPVFGTLGATDLPFKDEHARWRRRVAFIHACVA
jgi:hypothetical protein